MPPHKNHRGSIPGVEVGQSYGNREAMRAAGVHLATQAGIHGAVSAGGALSIICSSGYAGNDDMGDALIFSGQGLGKDQTLTGSNLALALTSGEKPDADGNSALVWKNSKVVRVVRNADKKNRFAPDVGCRYDGLYKLSRYTYEVGPEGSNGFKIYRFYFLRADGVPGPWTPEGKARIQQLNLSIVPSIVKKRKRSIKGKTEDHEATAEKETFENGDTEKDVAEKEIVKINIVEVNEEAVETSGTLGVKTRFGAFRPRPAGAIIGGRL